MANSPDFVSFVVDLLDATLGPVEARRMFGGHGVYARGVMFALVDDDELFLKTDEETRPKFEAAGCRMWVYPGAGMAETSYWRPPDEAHEDPEAMAPWARLGLEAALRKAAAKARKPAKKAGTAKAPPRSRAPQRGAARAKSGEAKPRETKPGRPKTRRPKTRRAKASRALRR